MSAELQTALTSTHIMDGGKQHFVLHIAFWVQGLLTQWPSICNNTTHSFVLALQQLLRLSHIQNKTLSHISASHTFTTFRSVNQVSHGFYGFG